MHSFTPVHRADHRLSAGQFTRYIRDTLPDEFFTSKQAAKIAGCTPRQLQYWRENGVVVPVVPATGTGRSVYYSQPDLVELAVMVYWLSVGLNFEVASAMLKELKEQEPELSVPTQGRRFMLQRHPLKGSLRLVEFDLDLAIASLQEGEPVIPIWLDAIHQRLVKRLKEFSDYV